MRRLLALSLAACLPAGAFAAEVTTVADVRVFGGQHYLRGTASDVSGNVDATVTPAVKFGETFSLMPTWKGEYRGTRDVQELAGGGTLFQDSTRQSLLAKGVWAKGAWKHKLALGAAYEWLRETKDKSWSTGLFNNRKLSAGVETERDFSQASGARLAYDYYMTAFPNYSSLESATSPTLSRELAGDKVLDSKSHLVTLGGWAPWGGARVEGDLHYNMRTFDDQNVLDNAGQFTGTTRTDKTLSLSGTIGSRVYALGESVKAAGELGLSYAMNSSNQNHFDANKTVFIPKYYDYGQWAVRPQVTAAFGEGAKPWTVSAGLGYSKRNYTDRPVQNAAGDYQGGKTAITETTASLGFGYHYSKNFQVRILGNQAWSSSNMKYEKTFRYNYRITNYMVGFSYEY
jgi:hypothetical protein